MVNSNANEERIISTASKKGFDEKEFISAVKRKKAMTVNDC